MGVMNLLAIFLLAVPLVGAERRVLLPTGSVRQQVGGIQTKLLSSDPNSLQREALFNHLKTKVTSFVIEQLEAEPRLTPEQLRHQLSHILWSDEQRRHDPGLSTAFAYQWRGLGQPGSVVWGVLYQGYVSVGFGGSRIV